MKKDGLKAIGLIVFGLLTAGLIYPFFHETGHTIAALSFGASVNEFVLFPLPSVLCNMVNVRNAGRIAVGFGGMVFPLLTALLISRRRFLLWYLRFLLMSISLLAIGISIISVAFAVNPQDDMVQVLKFRGCDKTVLLAVLGIGFTALLAFIVRDRPLDRILKYFNV